jgi:hypothetical protein
MTKGFELSTNDRFCSEVPDGAVKLSQAVFDSMREQPRIHHDCARTYDDTAARAVLAQPAHKLSDDEYFKISSMMSPGPWSANGKFHEMDLKTQEINGKNVVVYDIWRPQDPSKDSPTASAGPDDFHRRVFFVPNEANSKVDVYWFEAKNSEFDKAAKAINPLALNSRR